jgi:hypothetical protein
MARKKGGSKLTGKKKQSSIPPLLKRPPSGKLKKAAKRVSKGLFKNVYGAAEAMANPLAPVSNLVLGEDSKLNTRNLTRRFLPPGLKKLVPGGTQPPSKPKYGAGLIGPPEKPKTWRDRMNLRRKTPSR